MRIINKEIPLCEGVYVLYNTLRCLYMQYKGFIPENLEHELESVIDSFEKEYLKDYLPDAELVSTDLVEKVVFENKDEN